MKARTKDLEIKHVLEELNESSVPCQKAGCDDEGEWRAEIPHGSGFYTWYLCDKHASPKFVKRLLRKTDLES